MTRPEDSPSPEGRRLAAYVGLLTRRVQRARLDAAVPHVPPGARLLDLGCGVTELPDRFPAYVGCDRNPVVLDAMRRLHPAATFSPWDVEAGEAPPEVLGGAPYDAILMLALLEHLPDPSRALARAASLLAPGGRLIATTPHPLARLPLEAGARLGLLSRPAAEEHEALLDRAGLERSAEGAGLVVASYSRFLLGLNQLAVLSRR